MKLWGGRFSKASSKKAEEFTSSISFDKRLAGHDVTGSIAHARMLGNTGIITEEESSRIVAGLEMVLKELREGTFPFRVEHEDIHMNIEKRLTEIAGPVAGKLHTARSRNDQIALDEHMFVKEQCDRVCAAIAHLQSVLLEECREHEQVIMPGYTHTQRAQPTLYAHHMLAYFFMLERDYGRFRDCRARADVMPLGAGALAGTTFAIDPSQVASELGFGRLYENSADAVSDRDHILEFLAAAAILASHLSRLAEELVLWSSTEFGFIEMDDAYSTGSSIMPQKKNPDVTELIRGKTGRVYGHLVGLLVVMKGIPLAYNSDMQEDKHGLFDSADTVVDCLDLMASVVGSMKVNGGRMRLAAASDFSTATDVADYLASKGLPFRQAHEVAGRIVRHCLEQSKFLAGLTLDEYRSFCDLFQADIFDAITVEASVRRRASPGGTAPERVREQVEVATKALEAKRQDLRS
jgi:argininosuccinate lyase